MTKSILALSLIVVCLGEIEAADTFPELNDSGPPSDLAEIWGGFDPAAEPLETEILKQWEEDGVSLRVVRFKVGVFKGQPASVAAVYGFPSASTGLPGLVQIHGGGQYADENACIANAKRGYATLSIAWAGRISSSKYRVNPEIVKLFWDNRTDDPAFRSTTDWGAVDAYHAPSRNRGNQFPSIKPASWTLDTIESPRNSGWFLCAVAARRALTFLQQQPQVDPDRLGVYGHSMGGKLTVLTATDPRVKAAAPSCGGISDRYNSSDLFCKTLGDNVSLKQIRCPIIFLSPSNDFHGRIGDLPQAVGEIQTNKWRVTCSPHHNHQDTSEYEVATMLWFDEHLKNAFKMPTTPETSLRLAAESVPILEIMVDTSTSIESIDVYYTQHAKKNETQADREISTHRFWHHSKPKQTGSKWIAELPIISADQPLLAYANVLYGLENTVDGAGYYYRSYSTDVFNVSSVVHQAWPEDLRKQKVQATAQSTTMIETFSDGWQKEWFSYREGEWSRTTNKLNAQRYAAPENASLSLEVASENLNELVLLIDEHAAVIKTVGGNRFERFVLSASDFKNYSGHPLEDFQSTKRLKLSPTENLKPETREAGKPRVVGKNWRGSDPRFRNLKWEVYR